MMNTLQKLADEMMNQQQQVVDQVSEQVEQDVLANIGTFKAIQTKFGKFWGYKGQVVVKCSGETTDEEIKLFLEQGATALSINRADFIEKLQGSLKKHIKETFYVLPHRPTNLQELFPEELVNDLYQLSQLGCKNQYNVSYTEESGGIFVRVAYKSSYNPKFHSKNQPKSEKTLGQEQIAYIGVNTKNSRVGTIVPPKK